MIPATVASAYYRLEPTQTATMTEPTSKNRRSLEQAIRDQRAAYKKRHSSTGYQFVMADSIDLVPEAAWDRITENSSIFLSRRYLKVLETAGPENLMGRYAMAFQDGQPVAVIAGQLIDLDGRRLVKQLRETPECRDSLPSRLRRKVSSLMSSAKQKALAKIKGRLLMCGNALSWGFHGVAFAEGVTREDGWCIAAEALYRIRRAERLSGQTDIVLIKDFPCQAQLEPEELKPFEYRRLETDPNMVLTIPPAWKSFDDYLNSLASKYRSGAKKIVRDVENAGITLEVISDPAPIADRLLELYLNVQCLAAVRPVTIPASYLPTLAGALGSDFRCTVAKKNDEIVGFITSIRDGQTSVGYFVGFDYPTNETAPLYFRLLQICIDDAIRFGCTEVSFGRTALEPKARMGARPQPMEVWLRHRQPVMNWMIRSLLGAVPHDEAPDRNPFKA